MLYLSSQDRGDSNEYPQLHHGDGHNAKLKALSTICLPICINPVIDWCFVQGVVHPTSHPE